MPGYFDDVRYGAGAGSYGMGFNPDDDFRRPLSRFGGGRPSFAEMIPQRPVNQPPQRLGPSMRILGQPGQDPSPVSTPGVGGVLPSNQPPPAPAPALAPTKKKRPYFGPQAPQGPAVPQGSL